VEGLEGDEVPVGGFASCTTSTKSHWLGLLFDSEMGSWLLDPVALAARQLEVPATVATIAPLAGDAKPPAMRQAVRDAARQDRVADIG
jgi:hypothetical protein